MPGLFMEVGLPDMLKSHERFHSANGKRQILIADDEFVNRELLRAVLQNEYELLFATNGKEALDLVRQNKDTLSLVLLDLIMPTMSGMEMLKEAKADSEIAHIPVIVISADQDSEIECLTVGATDFIPKPYPQPGVILARILRTIELSEDRQIINSTERDALTGLYNREYFYRYAEQYDHHHKMVDMDAIVVDVNHFRMVNERFGTAFGNIVLQRIANALHDQVAGKGGIVCRREADTFMIYCPHGLDYDAILENASMRIAIDSTEDSDDPDRADHARIRLRMGVYAHVDKKLDIERRFDRAKMAADTVKGNFARSIGTYNSTLHERQLYTERLIEEFEPAIEGRQFQVYYQPKFDVQQETPAIASAEALVRWVHPTLGIISPGVFIPLFEENGLIQRLDYYVWCEAARQIADWRRRFGVAMPVSVNVSRVDMYDPRIVDTLQQILESNDLSTADFLLEITESAYTQDSDQIIECVTRLRSLGFKVEMDDFGTGYSSLNMISSLPVDVLKLDIDFIRNAFAGGRNTRMIEVIIDIADYLEVPVIAEGVETEEQMIALREMGCDYEQGYYFSRPVPADEYERFVIEYRDRQKGNESVRRVAPRGTEAKESSISVVANALSHSFEVIYYVDTINDHYVEFGSRGRNSNLQIEGGGSRFFEEFSKVVLSHVHPDDLQRVKLLMRRDAVLARLDDSGAFTITYRIRTAGTPIYQSLKAVRARSHDDHHMVIGISTIDTQVPHADENARSSELDFASFAEALSDDMESIYYVDTTTGDYQEFNTSGPHGNLKLASSGTDFFGECIHGIQRAVFADDRTKVALALEKQTLLDVLAARPVFSLTYRLLIDDNPHYYRLRAALANGARDHHLIIGISNIDDQISDENDFESQQHSTITYAGIAQALAADYFCIYYVNTETDRFIEYSSHSKYRELGIEQSGSDFFELSRRNMKRVIHPDDEQMFLSVFTKENVLAALSDDRTFTFTYRLLFPDGPTYAHMKATRMEDHDDPHIVIGVSNIDEQMRREQEHARILRMANQDALTGVKSKHAYDDMERQIDEDIRDASVAPFALAVCDVNGLKLVNDTRGHAAGDQLIKDACMIVCNIFKHSPVFRVGGDEFVAILRGSDYDEREILMGRLASTNNMNRHNGGVTVACGLAVWDSERDQTLASVFERADAAMYEDKRRFKE